MRPLGFAGSWLIFNGCGGYNAARVGRYFVLKGNP